AHRKTPSRLSLFQVNVLHSVLYAFRCCDALNEETFRRVERTAPNRQEQDRTDARQNGSVYASQRAPSEEDIIESFVRMIVAPPAPPSINLNEAVLAEELARLGPA